ncbi:NBS-LRR class resistance Fy8-Ry8 [Olea europaea subsp. europaea]|uniref:NBS-LRR class resistance Fy8-Ry8 n=1 Tax=Olea europaea subsp. europaea TaxID=158383 RepID=A0A8S0PNT5_OLEEU|nr:NBS-LRR class resistance Fy8-Ry8 [Olea europaea subsp. europaea]
MAHAAVVSLMQTLDEQVILHSDELQTLLNKKEIKSFHENLGFLTDFLVHFSQTGNEAIEILEPKIRNAALAAQHIIESHISNYSQLSQCYRENLSLWQILSGEKHHIVDKHYQRLHKIIQETDSITKEVMTIKMTLEHLQPRKFLRAHLSKLASKAKTVVLGSNNELTHIKDRMTSYSSKLNVVTIHGMDSCGKTTLIQNVFDDPLIEYHFPIRAWITIPQEYSEREILIGLLKSIKQLDDVMCEAREEQLSEHLYKSLKGRKYLIVMDNVRDTKVWDLVWRLLPKDDEGSRVLLTTSKPNVVNYVSANLQKSILSTYGHALTLANIIAIGIILL